MNKDDLYEELKSTAEEEQTDQLFDAKSKFNSDFNVRCCSLTAVIMVVVVLLLGNFVAKDNIQSIFIVGIPMFLILFFMIIFQKKWRKKYIEKKLKFIPIKNIDDIIKEQILQEIESSPATIECYKEKLKEATDDLRAVKERFALLQQLQWRCMGILADLNPKPGEWYSVLLGEGSIRFVAYINDASSTTATLPNLSEKRTTELFDPRKITFEQAKLAVEKEIADLQKEKPADIKDQETLMGLLRNAKFFYETMFPKV